VSDSLPSRLSLTRVCYTRWCINTIWPFWRWALAARNMWRHKINTLRKSASSWSLPNHARNIYKIYFPHRKMICDAIIEVGVLGWQQNNWIRVQYCGSNVNQKNVQEWMRRFKYGPSNANHGVLRPHLSHLLELRSRSISVSVTTEETRIVKISSEVNITGRSDTVMAKDTTNNVSF
jgi:hypothetical protein